MSKSKAFLMHERDGDHSRVVAELRVLVLPAAEGGFVAQGLEIDYVATGVSEDEARERFAKGFVATVSAYLRLGRDLAGLFKSQTPGVYWKAYFEGVEHSVLGCVVSQDVSAELPPLPPGLAVPHRLHFMKRPAFNA